MAPSPIVTATIQAAVITTISNLIAQAISAQQENVCFVTIALEFLRHLKE
jgi:hypothetical protein